MKYLVLYSEVGGHGWQYFEDAESAAKFIQERMSGSDRGIDKYEVFKGEQMKIVPVEKITKIEIQ